jgi:AAA15 family ATPase/GTPase
MSNESDGTMRYFGLSAILAILFRSNKVVGIDELESALHPDLMKHFLLQFLINASASQMIVTTHNALLLDDKDILRPDTIWFTQKANDGASSLYSLADFDSKIYRKGGSILNAYKSGRLGAKPDTIHMPVALN